MGLRTLLAGLIFILYLCFFFTIPLTLLWETTGFFVGLGTVSFLLVLMGFQGSKRIARRLNVQRLTKAEAPSIHAIVVEYCRRLEMPVPNIGMIETPAMNLAVFGFTPRSSWIVITRGALTGLGREKLSALIGRELTYLWHGEVFCESWLCQFLSFVDRLTSSPVSKNPSTLRRHYPFKLFLRQVFLYPLTLFPVFILKPWIDPRALDLKSIRITRHPGALAEGLRRLEAMKERFPFYTQVSTRHLFLIRPPTEDPVGRVLFDGNDLTDRIRSVESLAEVVSLA